jgi:hypothetical protein
LRGVIRIIGPSHSGVFKEKHGHNLNNIPRW